MCCGSYLYPVPFKKSFKSSHSDPVSSTLVPRIERSPVRGLFASSSTFNFELSTLQLPSRNSVPFPSSPLFSKRCALFCATATPQPFWNQLLAHSFYRDGGVGVVVFLAKDSSPRDLASSFPFRNSSASPTLVP